MARKSKVAKRQKVVKRKLPHAHETIERYREAWQAREARRAEANAAFERDHPFEFATVQLYGDAATFYPHLLVLAAANVPGAQEAVAQIDASLAPPELPPLDRRKAAMAAWFTDPRFDEEDGFGFEMLDDEQFDAVMEVLPEKLQAEVREACAAHGRDNVFVTRAAEVSTLGW